MEYKNIRAAGVLAHVSSLASPYGTGGFGKDTFAFIDLIRKAGFKFWQVLPLCPIGYGASPYNAISAFAGNELFIDIDLLKEEGFLSKNDSMPFYVDRSSVNWQWVKEHKMPLLKKAATTFLTKVKKSKKLQEQYDNFKKNNSYWLNDYATFRVISSEYNSYSWNTDWPKDLAKREKSALDKYVKSHDAEINVWMVLQFFFYDEWSSIKKVANAKDIKVIGDLPFCSSLNSSDVWAHTSLFYFNEKLEQQKSVGVPPDAFSKTGQLWGNPQYKWEAHKKENFLFWSERIKASLNLFDYLRLDHFRGFEASWTVDAKEKTAEKGKWVKSPGDELFTTLFKKFKITPNNNPFIAEDLGVITKEVTVLRKKFGFPSLRVMEFAFDHGNDDPHLPHMWNDDVIGYLGTHDNNTLIGWWQDDTTEWEKDRVRKYFYADNESAPWYMMRSLVASRAPVVMFTLQDLMFLPSSARFNIPGTVSAKNWAWRMTEVFDADKFKTLLQTFNR